MIKSKHRGHNIVFIDDEWVYEDTRTPTVDNERHCGHCKKPKTEEGYDSCLGTLPNVMNACCGHGQDDEAYIQYPDGSDIRGKDAIDIIKYLKLRQENIAYV